MSTDLPTLWLVEVSDCQKIIHDKEQAYSYAHQLQAEGRNVEIYENGKLLTRLKSQKQYSLFV
jgi:hypothetical protein